MNIENVFGQRTILHSNIVNYSGAAIGRSATKSFGYQAVRRYAILKKN
jgi:hypothetical protein